MHIKSMRSTTNAVAGISCTGLVLCTHSHCILGSQFDFTFIITNLFRQRSTHRGEWVELRSPDFGSVRQGNVGFGY